MFKSFLFQIHWFIGVTAGIVLAFVGFTGGVLSFESEIQQWLNRDVRAVPVRSSPRLSPAELLAELQKRYPDKRATALTLSADGGESARVTFALPRSGTEPAAAGPPGRAPRGEVRYVDPYDGILIEGEGTRGQQFFRTTRSLHRWLVAGDFGSQDVGRQLVGASTLMCVFLALSGLYLRWPRNLGNWRTWLTFDVALKGRSFLWHLHAVLGTWVLIAFLLMSLTGPYWSYDWYRNGLYSLAGVERPAPRGAPRPAGGPEATPASGGRSQRDGDDRRSPPSDAPARVNLESAWTTFVDRTSSTGYSTATLTLPQDARRPLEIRYMDADPAHDRAFNTISLNTSTGEVLRHERYADKSAGGKFMASIFPLHSGSFFGLPGVVAYMIASLSMPVFAITGWMMYLDRRRKKYAGNAVRRALASSVKAGSSPPDSQDAVLIAYASQAGNGRQIAWQTAKALQSVGVGVDVHPLNKLTRAQLEGASRALFVVSTFGAGDPPDDAKAFVNGLMKQSLSLERLRYGLLALGDEHFEHFCGFGVRIEHWLKARGAQELFPLVKVDNDNPQAISAWRKELSALAASEHVIEWQEPAFEDWHLVERNLLNPGSAGGSTFHLELSPPSASALTWNAGDIAELLPANSKHAVEAFLSEHALDGSALVTTTDSVKRTLADALKYSELPTETAEKTAQAIANRLSPLPKREFSIASVPADGRLHLVVRQTRRHDGTLGLGSGWLTAYADIGAPIRLRVRSNPAFHPPADSSPLILIGNGTGIAGLRSHLKAREAEQRAPNWLIFGERNVQHDFYFQSEIDDWRSTDLLGRVDLAFSRDQQKRVYVQHVLKEHARTLRAWMDEGAYVYVCGSAEGMAPAVDATLHEVLGPETMDRLAEQGRYRRDVY